MTSEDMKERARKQLLGRMTEGFSFTYPEEVEEDVRVDVRFYLYAGGTWSWGQDGGPLRDAWLNPGPAPDIHHKAKADLARRWPALHRALTEAFGP